MQVFGNKKGGKHSGGSNNTERVEAHVQREDEYIPQSDSVEKIKEKRSKKAKKKKTRK